MRSPFAPLRRSAQDDTDSYSVSGIYKSHPSWIERKSGTTHGSFPTTITVCDANTHANHQFPKRHPPSKAKAVPGIDAETSPRSRWEPSLGGLEEPETSAQRATGLQSVKNSLRSAIRLPCAVKFLESLEPSPKEGSKRGSGRRPEVFADTFTFVPAFSGWRRGRHRDSRFPSARSCRGRPGRSAWGQAGYGQADRSRTFPQPLRCGCRRKS